ncbi:MAG: hypothetical protein NTY74_14115 [Ignavibacteriae bacterium]|nr:hypothetical protein [Ignavibacteriota bacterium]
MEKYLERDLLNYLYFDLNRMRYIIADEIFEYDVQASAHIFLKNRLKGKSVTVQRESNGKVDNVINEYDTEGNLVNCSLIEMKSFIKKNEKLNYSKILGDIKKLKNKIESNIFGYFILVIKETHFKHKYKNKRNLKKLLNALSGNKKSYDFIAEGTTIKTRIIRSFKTEYKGGKNKTIVHNQQVRLFMFQIIKVTSNRKS